MDGIGGNDDATLSSTIDKSFIRCWIDGGDDDVNAEHVNRSRTEDEVNCMVPRFHCCCDVFFRTITGLV